jgi:FkbM family methyltransferase
MNTTERPYFYLGQGRGLTRLSTGEVFFVDTQGMDVGVWIMLGGVWETFVDDILCALERPGDTCLDVGANLGYYTIKMAQRVGPEGHVFSFEPNPKMSGFVGDNIRINGFQSRTTLVKAAAGAEPGVASLTFQDTMPGGGTVNLPIEWMTPDQERIEVKVVRIDDVVPQDAVVHLIKIDVEGFEPLALQGMKALLARSPDAAMVIEVSYLHWSKFGEPAQMVEAIADGRRIFRIHHDGEMEELAAAGISAALNRDDRAYRASQKALADAPPPPAAPAQPPLRPSLRARVRRRLLSWLLDGARS